MLAVVGRIQTGSYEKDGQKYYTTDVVVDEAYFTGEKREKENGAELSFDDFSPEDMSGDDLPF